MRIHSLLLVLALMTGAAACSDPLAPDLLGGAELPPFVNQTVWVTPMQGSASNFLTLYVPCGIDPVMDYRVDNLSVSQAGVKGELFRSPDQTNSCASNGAQTIWRIDVYVSSTGPGEARVTVFFKKDPRRMSSFRIISEYGWKG